MSVINYYDKDFIMFYLDSDVDCAVNRALIEGRVWEKGIINMYKCLIKKTDIVLDIGAHLGTHSIPMSVLAKRVYAFEPQKKLCSLLSTTIEENKIKNIKLYNRVVADTTDEEVVFINSDTGRASTQKARPYLIGEYTKEKTVTIDSLGLRGCDFIKIDTEKTEWDVLKGAKLTILHYKPKILLETFKTKGNINRLNCFCDIYDYNYQYIACNNYLLTYKYS